MFNALHPTNRKGQQLLPRMLILLAVMLSGSAFSEEQLVNLETYDLSRIKVIDFYRPLWVTPQPVESDGVKITKVKTKHGYALDVLITDTELHNPGIMLLPPDKHQLYWDISRYEHLYADIENMDNDQQVIVSLRVTNPLVGKYQIANNSGFGLNPNEKRTLKFYYPQADEFAKCRIDGILATPPGIPGKKNVNGRRVDGIIFFGHNLIRYTKKLSAHYRISNIRMAKPYKGPGAPVNDPKKFYPFVDKYGQYKHQDWPDKIHSDSDFQKAVKKENDTTKGRIKSWSKWGGWKEGPKLQATGFFRAETYKGKWYLVDPDGYLFFSHGVNAVRSGDRGWAGSKLPDKWFATTRDPKHKSWNFYESNLQAKYGKNYMEKYPDIIDRRMQSWGLNTIGNWSDLEFYKNHKTPYTMEIPRARAPRTPSVDGQHGIVDVFSAEFENSLLRNIKSKKLAPLANDPWCVGIFINNEIKWGTRTSAARSALAAKADQPIKQELIKDLQQKYVSIQLLNRKWGTAYINWNALQKNTDLPDAERSREDMLAFNIRIFDKYYSVCRKVVKTFSPNIMYLGSRLHMSDMPELYSVASKYCDVVAINIYSWSMDGIRKRGLPNDKPVLISEFHVGVLDRGMFNADCRPAGITQDDRAHAYLRLMQGGLLHPQVVGMHHFCYRDEPLTGRWSGIGQENFAIGIVDTADTPYWEMANMMRRIGEHMLPYRLAGTYKCNWTD